MNEEEAVDFMHDLIIGMHHRCECGDYDETNILLDRKYDDKRG
jgi:hypothetical protein